jgi:hypothetical protein
MGASIISFPRSSEGLATMSEVSSLRRRDMRRQIRTSVKVNYHNRFQTVDLVEFSLGGLRTEGIFGLAVGDTPVVELQDGHQLHCRVVWVVGAKTGLALEPPLEEHGPVFALLSSLSEKKRD